MKAFFLLITLIAVNCKAFSQDTNKLDFIVLYTTGENWEPEKPFHEQSYAEDHSKHLASLRKENKVSIGGRYRDTGLLLIKAKDETEAKALITSDASVKNGIFNTEIHPFDPFYSGCVD